MRNAWHLLTGEYPPSSGGVSDYTRALACELARRGLDVHVWCPSVASDEDDAFIRLHALPDSFGARTRRTLEEAWRAVPGIVLLQYVPNALGAGGLNIPFCWWLRRMGEGGDVRVMFHEPYFYFSWSPLGNVRALVQRLMGRLLVSASRTVYFSTEAWRRYLPAAPRTLVLPVPSTIPSSCDRDAAASARARIALAADAQLVGHFGTYGHHVARELDPVVSLLLESRLQAHFLCIGRGSERFAAALRERLPHIAPRLHHTGSLSSSEVAAAIHACDVMVQPFPDGITTRRTSVMAPLANAVATVSTAGALTERVWRETGAVALAPAGNAPAITAKVAELLDNPGARASLADAGRRAYDEHFAIARSVDALLIQP